jgi:hypothetical protein
MYPCRVQVIFTFNDVPILNLALFLDDFCEENRALESVYVRNKIHFFSFGNH